MEKILLRDPNISYYHQLFSHDECDFILNNCHEFKRSLNYSHSEKKSVESDHRTSFTYTNDTRKFSHHNEKIYQTVKNKFWQFDNFTIDNFESVQILRYDVSQEFKPHFDYFYKPNDDVYNDRIATMIVYLNDNYEGGETIFPKVNLTIKPVKGSAVFFEYKYVHEINMKTLHAGLPVISGTKYITTTWIRPKSIKFQKM